jgi:hypothetical protein
MALIAATYAHERSLSLGLATYDALLECCTYRADVKSAIQVYAHMEWAEIKPSVRTFSMMLTSTNESYSAVSWETPESPNIVLDLT